MILTTGSGIGITFKFMAKKSGKDRRMDIVHTATNEMMAVDSFCGVLFVAEYTIILYLKIHGTYVVRRLFILIII